jgi:hypothetical protein
MGGWANHGSIALAVSQDRTWQEAAHIRRELRAASLQRWPVTRQRGNASGAQWFPRPAPFAPVCRRTGPHGVERSADPLVTLRVVTDHTHPAVDEHASADGHSVPHSRGDSDLINFSDEPQDDKPAGRKPRRLWIMVAVLGAVVLVLGVLFGPTAIRVLSQKGATLTMPATVGNLTRDDSDAAKATATDLVTALRASIDLDNSQGAVYSNADQTVMLFGGTTLLWSPERELDTVLTLMEDKDEQGLRDLKTVDPGPLGGVMKCGLSDALSASAMAVCGWADHGSIALALFPAHTADEAAPLMRELRAASLKR